MEEDTRPPYAYIELNGLFLDFGTSGKIQASPDVHTDVTNCTFGTGVYIPRFFRRPRFRRFYSFIRDIEAATFYIEWRRRERYGRSYRP